MDGVIGAQIGSLSLIGTDDILGGKQGFLSALTDTPHEDALTDFSNDDYAIEGIYQKVHAACRHCHPAVDATLDIRKEHIFTADQIDKIEVRTYKLGVGSHDHTDIKGISSAKLSTPFAIALAIVKGSVGYADYTENNLNDYWIKNVTGKVKVMEDNHLTTLSPAIRGAKVTIYLKGGEVFENECLYPKGEPENPLSHQELEDKFRGLARYRGMSADECDEIINEISNNNFDLERILNILYK